MEANKAPSLQNVCIVCGAPGSGKTTFVQKTMRKGDVVVDMDALVSALTGNKEQHPDYATVMDIALSVREAIYKKIVENRTPGKRAFVITSSANQQHVNQLAQRLSGHCHYMDTPQEECIRRINNDPTRPNKENDVKLVQKWFAERTRQMSHTELNTQTTSTEERTGVQQPAPENGSTQPEQEKRFTQSDVDRIVKERLKRAERTADSTQSADLEARNAELNQRQNLLECREYLLNSGYNSGLLDILDTSDPEKFKSSAGKLQRLIDAEKRKAQPVAPMRGDPDPSGGRRYDSDSAFARGVKHKPRAYPPVYDDND